MGIISIVRRQIKRLYKYRVNRLIRKSEDGVDYIWLNHQSDTLIIVFSAIGSARFNYYRALKDCKYDQLFIRDCWAGGVSYYWYEKSSNHPEIFTLNLINSILEKKYYKSIMTIGSSKGGTAAVYYGLKLKATMVIAGACQYRVGDYLSRHQYKDHPEQWEAVVGEYLSEKWIKILDTKVEDMIEQNRESKTKLRLIYSNKEHTYPEHIQPLIEKLNECGIEHEDQIESFPEHSMIGECFTKALVEFFK